MQGREVAANSHTRDVPDHRECRRPADRRDKDVLQARAGFESKSAVADVVRIPLHGNICLNNHEFSYGSETGCTNVLNFYLVREFLKGTPIVADLH